MVVVVFVLDRCARWLPPMADKPIPAHSDIFLSKLWSVRRRRSDNLENLWITDVWRENVPAPLWMLCEAFYLLRWWLRWDYCILLTNWLSGSSSSWRLGFARFDSGWGWWWWYLVRERSIQRRRRRNWCWCSARTVSDDGDGEVEVVVSWTRVSYTSASLAQLSHCACNVEERKKRLYLWHSTKGDIFSVFFGACAMSDHKT